MLKSASITKSILINVGQLTEVSIEKKILTIALKRIVFGSALLWAKIIMSILKRLRSLFAKFDNKPYIYFQSENQLITQFLIFKYARHHSEPF